MASENLDRPKTPCPSCGHLSDSYRITCDNCGALLHEVPGSRPAAIKRDRPGCVTAYAVLLGIGGAIGIVASIILGANMLSYDSTFGAILCIGGPLIASINFVLVYGLWNLKNWARIIIIVLQSLGIASTVCSWVYAIAMSSSYSYGYNAGASVGGGIVGLVINIVILNWFATHGEYFN